MGVEDECCLKGDGARKSGQTKDSRSGHGRDGIGILDIAQAGNGEIASCSKAFRSEIMD